MTQLRISEMKELNKGAGQHWFDKGAMEFFNTKIEAQPNKANLFITSEFMEDPATKRFTVRKFDLETNKVVTLGDFQEFGTLAEARAERTWRTKWELGNK